MTGTSIVNCGNEIFAILPNGQLPPPRAAEFALTASNYPRLNAGFGFRSSENASGAGSQPKTLRPP